MEPDTAGRIENLPVFPLSAVLFPGAVIPLHIFEERYKTMMRYAIDNRGQFGLSFRDDAAVGLETLPEIGSVGCLARINAVVPLEEGRMNIISTGVVRYRVVEYGQLVPFLLADVETFSDQPEPEPDLDVLKAELMEACKGFLSTATSSDDPWSTISKSLPEDPELFSLMISSVLPLKDDLKQQLLEITSTRGRLVRLQSLINELITRYSERVELRERSRGNGRGRLTN